MTDFHRRRFLKGAGGVALALPFLESLAPRQAFGQTVRAPLRFVLVYHSQGLVDDFFWPAQPGPLPQTLPRLLEPFSDVRGDITLVGGADSIAGSANWETDGHQRANISVLTCQVGNSTVDGSGTRNPNGPSIDYAVGQRLAAGVRWPSLVFSPTLDHPYDLGGRAIFAGQPGQVAPTQFLPHEPHATRDFLFSDVSFPESGPPPVLTLRERLQQRRGSILDSVLGSLSRLRARVSATDRARLDAHTEQVRAFELRSAPGAVAAAQSCSLPDLSTIPVFSLTNSQAGLRDNETSPAQVENVVMALACGLTRSAAFYFHIGHEQRFPWQYGGDQNAILAGGFSDWHDVVHRGWFDYRTDYGISPQDRLVNGQRFYASQVALLLRRLAEVDDVDGTKLIDNTLVVWMTDFGRGNHNGLDPGDAHGTRNLPIVFGGLRRSLNHGPGGRYLRYTKKSIGDVHATILNLMGQPDQTFGITGVVGDHMRPADITMRPQAASEALHYGLLEGIAV